MAQFPWINSMNKSADLSRMTMGSGIQTGNPSVDMMLNMFMGNMLAPVPGAGQSILDAYKMKERSRDYMSLMRKAVGSSTIAQHIGGPMGFNTDSLSGGALTQFAGMSGIMDNSMIQAMNGGNPVKALMGLKANMTGMTMGQAFGQVGNADNETVLAAFKGMQDQLFKTRTIGKTDLREQEAERSASLLKGMTPEARAAMSKFIKSDKGKEVFDFDSFDKQHKDTTNSFTDRQEKLKNDYEDYSKEIKNLQEAKSKYVDSIKDESLKKDAGANYDKHSASAVQEISNRLKQNADAFKKLEKEKADYEKSIGDTLDASKSVMAFRTQNGQKINVSADPEKMRGFKSHDLTKSKTMMMDLNMAELSPNIKNNKDIALRDKAYMLGADIAKNSIGALSAMRDLTGAEDAGTATAQLNSMYGNGNMNLATAEGGAQAENLIRRVKAAGRNAGIGLDAIMEVLNQVKEIAAAHPELKYTGGDVHMETTIKALNTTSALTAAMGNTWTRMNGGQAEINRMVTENKQGAQTRPITNEILGVVGLISGDSSLSPERKKFMLDELNKWTNNQDSVFASGNHGFMDGDKAAMLNKMATMSGRDASDYYNALNSPSSSVSGRSFANKHKEYNFAAAGEHGEAYDYINKTIALEIASHAGATDADVARITKEASDDFANMSATGETLEDILAKTRKLASGKKITLSTGDAGALIERNARDPQLMFAYTLHQKMMDPKFKAQYDKQLDIQNIHATEEARMDKDMARLRQPFFDTIIQAYMSGSFGKGKEEILSMVSTPEHQQRASDMLDALNANSANTTGASFRNVMMESLGGREGLSREAVDKNLALLGVTDSGQLADIHSRRRFWSENNQGYSDFIDITKNNTLTSVEEAYNELVKNGKVSPELLTKLNTTEGTLRSAGGFMKGAKIAGVNQTGEEYMNKSPMANILKQASHIGYESTKKSLLELKSKELSGYYQTEEETGDAEGAHSQLSLLAAAGYITRKDGKTGNSWSDFDWEKGQITGYNKYLADREAGASLDGGRLDQLLVGGKDIKKAYNLTGDGALGANEKKYLAEYGAVSVDKNGVATWNDEKLKELTYKRKGLKVAGENQLFSATGDRLDEVKKNIDTNVTKIDQGLAVEQLKDMTSSMSTAAKGITSELSRLISVFTGALGK